MIGMPSAGPPGSRTPIFFLKEWLYVPALVDLATLGDPVMVTSAILLGGALLSSSLFHSVFPHYWAAYTSVIVLLAIRGLMRVWQWQPSGRPVGKAVAAFFIVGAFATILRAVPIGPILGISDYGDPYTLPNKVAARLSATEGQRVVFVKYRPTHTPSSTSGSTTAPRSTPHESCGVARSAPTRMRA